MSHSRRSLVSTIALAFLWALPLLAGTATELAPQSAPTGARFVVAGSGLDTGVLAISFSSASGPVPAQIVSRTASLAEGVVPATATTGGVLVAQDGAAIGSFGFTVTPPPGFGHVATLAASDKAHDVLKSPAGVAVIASTGAVIVADTAHHRIVSVSGTGVVSLLAGSGKPGQTDGAGAAAQFKSPGGVAVDEPRRVIYVADMGNNVIRRVTFDGMVSTLAGSGRGDDADGTGTEASFKAPTGIATDFSGNVYVADTGNGKIKIVSPAGVVHTIAGATHDGFGDGPALQALFKQPQGVAVSSTGVVFISDTGNNVIRKLENGVVTTIAGTGHAGYANGSGAISEFKQPSGITVDDGGNVYVGDTQNNAIRRVTIAGTAITVSTLAGGGKAGLLDGDPVTAQFNGASGIFAQGALFIADTKNDALRLLYPELSLTDVYPSVGDPNGGTLVKIFGTGFVPGATQIRFGATAASAVTYVSSTEIVATTPRGTIGSVDVTAATPAGTATLKGAFTYQPPFTSILVAPTSPTIDPGRDLQFTAQGIASDNSATDITNRVAWSSSIPSAASISATGLAHAIAPGTTTITATLGAVFRSTTLTVQNPEPLPPDPATVATKIDPTIVAPFTDTIRFLYSGPNAIQTGVAPNAIRDDRAAVVRGRVITPDGQPFGGVHVTALGHPEYGQTLSRADGMFDYVINGGGALTLQFSKTNYIAAQRAVTAKWGQQTHLADVALVLYDPQVTSVTFGGAANQVARGSAISDSDGQRRATVIIPAGTNAALTLPDGSSQPAGSLHIRATEYTVGPNGPKAMPATLPPSIAYTYCVELSADEAVAAGASTITFSKPVPLYVDNFLGMPVGTIVPSGSYDRGRGAWITGNNGVVLKIVSITNGAADIDINGDGVADDVSSLGIDSAERQTLAGLYPAGKSLWRVPTKHFTPLDLNFSYELPAGSSAPAQDEPLWIPAPSDHDCGADVSGHSIINCYTQTLRESIAIVGTPWSLDYASSRNSRTQYKTTISVTGASVPPSASRVELSIGIAGQFQTISLPPQPNQTYDFTWDGMDAYGRSVQGAREASVTISYVYPTTYGTTGGVTVGPLWGIPASRPLIPARSGAEAALTQTFTLNLGHMDAGSAAQFGGWTLSPQRFYDGGDKTIYDGGGQQRSGDPDHKQRLAVTRFAGTGECCAGGDGGPATQAKLNYPSSIAVAPDGTVYLADQNTIRKVDPAGNIATVVGPGVIRYPWLAVGPDGALYASDYLAGKIYRVDGGGLTIVAGGGSNGAGVVYGVPATQVTIRCGTGIAAGGDGSIYVADCNRVLRIGPDGLATTVYGGTAGQFILPITVGVGPDGSVYAGDENLIHRIAPSGDHSIFAGNTSAGTLVDGAPATSGSFSGVPSGIDVAPDGTVIVADQTGIIYAISPDGTAKRLIGTGAISSSLDLDGALARAASVAPYDVRVGPDGSIYFPDQNFDVIRKAANVFPVTLPGDAPLPSPDGSLVYVFTNARHTRSVNTLTGTTELTLAYDANGALTAVTDADANTTTIERDVSGNATSIVSPGGQRTTLAMISGRLATVQNPATERIQLAYDPSGGLLTQLTDARGGMHKFIYDADGLLTKDEGPAGGFISMSRAGNARSFAITATTAEGRVEHYVAQLAKDTTATRDHTAADGTTTHSVFADASDTSTSSDGTTSNETTAADPRFGMRAPLSVIGSVSVGGHTMRTAHSRTITTSANDPLVIASLTDTLSVNGRQWTSAYDGSSRVSTTKTPAGRTVTSTLDARGRTVSVAQPGLTAVSIAYNAIGRLASLQQGTRTTTFAYDGKQQLASVTDPLGRTVGFDYDNAGRVTSQTLFDGRVVGFTYDTAGNVTSVTPPSRPGHLFAFTPENLTSVYTPPPVPSTGTTQYAYNLDRQLTQVLRPDGKTIALTYDNGARLAATTIGRGSYRYGYDPTTGNLISITTPESNALSLVYSGSLLTSVAWSGPVSGSIAFAYDDDFRAVSETIGSNAIVFGYDADSLLASAGALTLQRDPQNGLLTGTAIGNVSDTWSYNAFGEPATYAASYATTPVYSQQFTRDDTGRITQVVETLYGATATFGYAYDSADRLAAVTQDGQAAATYSYDPNGNRLAKTAGTNTETGTYDDQDRLLTYAGAAFAYTANGELASKTTSAGTTSYIYDELGNLLSVTLPNGTVIEYVIDGRNRRVGKKIYGVLVQGWLYSGQLQIAAELDGSGAIVSRFIYGSRGNVPDYMIKGGATYRIIYNHLGSPRAVVDVATGAIAQMIGYDEFGNVLGDTSPGLQPFGFAGGLYDADTGLVRFGARDYDARTGRWISKDISRFSGRDNNLYRYAASDPANMIDTTGLGNVQVGVSGAFMPVIGADGSVTVVANTDTGETSSGGPANVGIAVSHGGGVGVNAGVGIVFGWTSGPITNVDGHSVNWGAGLGNGGVTASMDPKSCKITGGTITYGPSVYKIGGSLTVDKTTVYTVQDGINWISDLISSAVVEMQNKAWGGK